MTSNRPYLVRALYEWILDNEFTPYVLIDAQMPGVEVPEKYVEEGKIVLNISSDAVQELRITNQVIEFSASFSGLPMFIYAPINAVLAIYAHENGRGMIFGEEEEDEGDSTPPPLPPRSKSGKPKLTIVK